MISNSELKKISNKNKSCKGKLLKTYYSTKSIGTKGKQPTSFEKTLSNAKKTAKNFLNYKAKNVNLSGSIINKVEIYRVKIYDNKCLNKYTKQDKENALSFYYSQLIFRETKLVDTIKRK